MDRVSAYTGIPALLGWQGHEEQWRRGQYADIGAVLSVRTELEASYLDGAQPDASNGQPTILILGRFETEALPGCGLTVVRADGIVATLENAGWRQAFESVGTRVFVRAGRAGAGALDVRRARLIGVTVR
jgi:hypothetical protein